PRWSILNSKVYMDVSCIHCRNRSINRSPFVCTRVRLNAWFLALLSPVVLVAYPADIELFVYLDKLGICIDRCKTVRAISSACLIVSVGERKKVSQSTCH